MKFNDINLILEKRKYEHRQGYEGNIKGSYINKGKTKWKYSEGEKPGNERIVSQIQNKSLKKHNVSLSRKEVKDFLKSKTSDEIFKNRKKKAKELFGSDEDDENYRGFLYGGFATIVSNILAAKKSKK